MLKRNINLEELVNEMIEIVRDHAAEICPECYPTFFRYVEELNDGNLKALVKILDYALSYIPTCRYYDEH